MQKNILLIENQLYPFDSTLPNPSIYSIQTFQSKSQLQIKKAEMKKKIQIISSPLIIQMEKIIQEKMTLKYNYEYIPYSLKEYLVQMKQKEKFKEILQMAKKLFFKKLEFDLNLIAIFLSKMRIEVSFRYENIGISANEKTKLFINENFKINTKSEIYLYSMYKALKENILKDVELDLMNHSTKECKMPNFIIQGNKLIFVNGLISKGKMAAKILENHQISGLINEKRQQKARKNLNSTEQSEIYYHPKIKKYSECRSSSDFKLGQSTQFQKKGNLNSKSREKVHKNSFQFNRKKSKETEQSQYFSEFPSDNCQEDNNQDNKSITHSTSIRIELHQKETQNDKNQHDKERKESYKVKITRMDSYEMDDCRPEDIRFATHFANGFNHKQSNAFNHKQSNAFNHKQSNAFNHKQSRQDVPENNFQRKPKYSEHFPQMNSKLLQEKVKEAKQKAENVLNQYQKAKKNKFSHQ